MDRIRDHRFLNAEPEIPPAFALTATQVRTPMVWNEIDRLVANITFNGPIFKYLPPAPGPEAARFSSKLEQAIRVIWDQLDADAHYNLFRTFIDKCVATPYGVLKVTLATDRWDAQPTQDDDEDPGEYLKRVDTYRRTQKALPVAMTVADTRTLYPFPDERGWKSVVEITSRLYDDVMEEYNDGASVNGVGLPVPPDSGTSASSDRQVTLIEYWDREWCVIVLQDGQGIQTDGQDGQVLRRFRHGYGRVPYFHALGNETGDSDPNYASVPALYSMIYLAPFFDSLLTMWANVAYLTGFPTMTKESPLGTFEGGTDDDAQEATGEKVRPGTMLEGPPGTRYGVLDFSAAGTALTGMVAKVQELLQGSMLPSVMQGIPPGSRTAGYAINELASAAKARYQTIIKNAARAMAQAMDFILWLLEHKVRGKLYLVSDMVSMDDSGKETKYRGRLELNTEDIKGYYNTVVTIQPRLPVDRIQEGTFMANMHAGGLIPKRRALEEGLGYEQPDQILDELDVEDFMQEPEIRRLIVTEAVREAGLAGMIADLQAAQDMYAQQMAIMNGMSGGMSGGMGGPPGATTNGNALGMQSPGAPATVAPSAPGMEVPGMPASPGMGMAQQNPFANQQPRLYRGAKRGGIAGFRAR